MRRSAVGTRYLLKVGALNKPLQTYRGEIRFSNIGVTKFQRYYMPQINCYSLIVKSLMNLLFFYNYQFHL